uniref:Uncharacterized protein n=1 Tax=Romanomermis culicivorax TaxID=13658 RepID=A0A915KGH3_ROMCU
MTQKKEEYTCLDSCHARKRTKALTGGKSHSVSSAGAIQNQLDYLRLEHDRAMREERRQNCYLCAIIVLSLSMAAALIPAAFVNKFSDLICWNWTENAENLIADILNNDNADVLSTMSTTVAAEYRLSPKPRNSAILLYGFKKIFFCSIMHYGARMLCSFN